MSGHEKKPLVPLLRFPEFRDAGEWESKPLKFMGSFFRGLTYSADEVSEEGLLVLRSSNIQDGTLVLDKDLVFVKKTCPDDIQLRSGDIAICMSNGSKALVGKNAEFRGNYDHDLTVGAFCSIFRPSIEFSKLIFQTPKYTKFISVAIGGGNINNLKNSDLGEFEHPVPKLQPEQQKIADCLSSLDDLIAAESQKLDTLKTHKKGLMQQLFPREGETVPRLRFPEFREAPAWGKEKLEKLITTVSPPSKLQSSNYGTQGKFPIIDQSQEFICGWTDDERAVITESLPLIIFGDHTCALKFVDKPFAQGADGIKILKVRPAISAEYLFHSLSHRPLAMEDYKRHFSMLKERAVVFPDIESGEQQKIADCLSSLDDLITAQTQKIDALKTHKKGLMQQLFPTLDEVDA